MTAMTKRPRTAGAKDKLFLVIIFAYLLISLYRLSDVPAPWYDEIGHLNTAQHVAREGRFWCDFFNSKFASDKLFNSLPLQWVLLGGLVKLFGLSLFTARLFYVILSAGTLCCVYFLTKRMCDRKIAIIALLALASSSIFFLNSRQLIPQVLATVFAIAGLLAFYAAEDKKSKLLFSSCGALTALACLSHPTGAPAFFAITLLFLYHKSLNRNYLFYLSAFFVSLLPYLLYVAANIHEYLAQISIISKEIYSSQPVLLTILDEIPVRYLKLSPVRYVFENIETVNGITNRYIYNINWLIKNLDLRVYICDIASAALFLSSLIYLGLKRKKGKSERELFYITIIYFIFLSLHPNKFPAYIYVISPYLAICLAVWIRDLLSVIPSGHLVMKIKNSIVFIFILSFFLLNLLFIYKSLSNKRYEDYVPFINKVEDFIPKGSTVAGPAYFWLGMQREYNFITVNEIVYRIDKILREEKGGAAFSSISKDGQDELVRRILSDYGIRYFLLTCHAPEEITEAPMLAGDATHSLNHSLRRYLFYHAKKEADFLKENYYSGTPEAADAGKEKYYPPPGVSFSNVTAEYQNSLKIYRLK